MSASKAKAHSTTFRIVTIGAAIVAIGFVIGLAVAITRSTSPSTTTTTTVPSSAFRDQVASSQRQTAAVAAAFLRAQAHCASATCIDDAAAAALSAEGAIAAKFNPVNFPANASSVATAYSNLLVALQRTYLSIGSSTSETTIAAMMPDFKKGLQLLAQSAQTVENAL